MEIEILNVGELIDQLKKMDPNMEVYVGAVGLNAKDSWDAPLTLQEYTVDEWEGYVRINFSLYG